MSLRSHKCLEAPDVLIIKMDEPTIFCCHDIINIIFKPTVCPAAGRWLIKHHQK
jgi:hypothetical protein